MSLPAPDPDDALTFDEAEAAGVDGTLRYQILNINGHVVRSIFVCEECGRVFDMNDETDAEEWNYGHDCEDT